MMSARHKCDNAVAVLSVDLPRNAERAFQLTPDGIFRARDGRPAHLPGWRMDAGIAQRLIDKLRARQTPVVVDYEHQTINTERNGKPAPAAGWIDPATVEYRPGHGLFAGIAWTPRAQAMIGAGEYKYLSPVLPYDTATGEILDLLHVALTNLPAVDGMAVVAALASRYALDPPHVSASRVAPDPAKYAPIDVVFELQSQIAELMSSAGGVPEAGRTAMDEAAEIARIFGNSPEDIQKYGGSSP